VQGAACAAGFDAAADGTQGGESGQGRARAGVGQEAFEEVIEAEELPGAAADVHIAEAARVTPADRAGIDARAGAGAAGA